MNAFAEIIWSIIDLPKYVFNPFTPKDPKMEFSHNYITLSGKQ